jgi:hypothetical protein
VTTVARGRGPVAVALTVCLLALGCGVAPATLARFTDAAPSGATLSTDTLAPPTGLAAVGGSAVTLSWTRSADAYAAGYAVFRSATSGGAYTQVSVVTPGSTTTTGDSPANGTWYYVLRSTYQSWTSVTSNEASASVGVSASTAFVACTSQAAVTSGAGDNNGYQGNPARACVDDSTHATDPRSGTGGSESCGAGAVPDPRKDQHRFSGFGFGLPGSVNTIDGIRVRADLGMNNTTGATAVCAQLSWDGGATWTTMRSVTLPTAAEAVYLFGSTSDTWGRTWTAGNLNSGNFRVRLIDASTLATKRFDLDYVAVSVTYRP